MLPEHVVDVRYLIILLVSAERAWSYAMELKQDVASEPRRRFRLLRRLCKAEKWATELAKMSSLKADSRTALEAEAYASWMSASVMFEKENDWEGALGKFLRTRTVYEQLSKLKGDMEQQALCRERVEELEPSIRYCEYNLKRAGKSGDSYSDLRDLDSVDSPGDDLLKSKLESVLAEERTRQAEKMSELSWQGKDLPVRNNTTRLSILNAQALVKQLEQIDDNKHEKKMGIYDKCFIQYNDAKRQIRDDLSLVSSDRGDEGDAIRSELNTLDFAVNAMLLQQTINRNKMMVGVAQAQLERQQAEQGEKDASRKGEKTVRPADLVKLYNTLLANLSELSDSSLASAGASEEEAQKLVVEQCRAEEAAVRAARCYYLSQAHSAQGESTEAYLLLGRAIEHTREAIELATVRGEAGAQALPALQNLLSRARTQRCLVHANVAENAAKEESALGKEMSDMALKHKPGIPSKWLLENLDEYVAVAGKKGAGGAHIMEIPPALQAVQSLPIVLDAAFDSVEFPSLDGRCKAAPAKGRLQRFFGWGAK